MYGDSTSAPVQAMIIVLFEKEHRSVRPALLNLKGEHRAIVRTSFSAPMDGELDIEIILVRGDTTSIRAFEQQITAKRGVRSARLTVIPS